MLYITKNIYIGGNNFPLSKYPIGVELKIYIFMQQYAEKILIILCLLLMAY